MRSVPETLPIRTFDEYATEYTDTQNVYILGHWVRENLFDYGVRVILRRKYILRFLRQIYGMVVFVRCIFSEDVFLSRERPHYGVLGKKCVHFFVRVVYSLVY